MKKIWPTDTARKLRKLQVKLLAVVANDELAEANHGELVVHLNLLQAIFIQDAMPLVK